MSSVAIVLGPPRSLSHRQVPLSSLSFLSWKAANSSAWGLVQCCPWLAERDWRKAPLGSCFPTARCQVVEGRPACRPGFVTAPPDAEMEHSLPSPLFPNTPHPLGPAGLVTPVAEGSRLPGAHPCPSSAGPCCFCCSFPLFAPVRLAPSRVQML